ncbi:MAG: alpha/beta hydrolase [Bacteroidales bacterium]
MSLQTMQGTSPKTFIYLIPGQGSDYRLFKNLSFDTAYTLQYISWPLPAKDMTMTEFAKEISHQIDTTQKFILIGVSLGGMVATEICEYLHPEKTILISSAKCRNELPGRYKFQRKFPVYKIVPGRLAKLGAKILQPIVEPDRKNEKQTCKNMLKDKDPEFLKRTIKMILEWERMDYNSEIIHIHGDNDHTIPARNVKYNYLVKNGSHMMTLTKGEEISKLINIILSE